MRSTTIAVTGEHGRIIGLMCINFYLNTPLSSVLKDFIFSEQNEEKVLSESFANNIEDVLKKTIEDVQKLIMEDPVIPASKKSAP